MALSMQNISKYRYPYLQSIRQSSPKDIACSLVGAALVYQLFDQAIANLLALET